MECRFPVFAFMKWTVNLWRVDHSRCPLLLQHDGPWRESPWSNQSLTGQPDWYPAVTSYEREVLPENITINWERNVSISSISYLWIQSLNIFLHVWIFHRADRKVGATNPNGQHFITGLLAFSRPGTFLRGGTFLPDLCRSLWAWGWPLWSQQDVQSWCSAGYGLTGLARLQNFLFVSIIFTYNSQMYNTYNLN